MAIDSVTSLHPLYRKHVTTTGGQSWSTLETWKNKKRDKNVRRSVGVK